MQTEQAPIVGRSNLMREDTLETEKVNRKNRTRNHAYTNLTDYVNTDVNKSLNE